MKLLKEMAAPMYLGFALSAFANIHWFNWQFWAILVPFFILVRLTKWNQIWD